MTLETQPDKDKRLTTIIYALYALGPLIGGITSIAAIIINYVKKDDVANSWLATHFRWQIRTFWFSLLWGFIGIATCFIGIGFVALPVAGIWYIYRIVKGWVYLNDNKPMYVKPVPPVAANPNGT